MTIKNFTKILDTILKIKYPVIGMGIWFVWHAFSYNNIRLYPNAYFYIFFVIFLIISVFYKFRKNISEAQTFFKRLRILVSMILLSVFSGIFAIIPYASISFGGLIFVEKTYQCGSETVLLTRRFKDTTGLYTQYGPILKGIDETKYFKDKSINPYYKYESDSGFASDGFRDTISKEDIIKYIKCIPSLKPLNYQYVINPCDIVKCQKDGFKSTDKNSDQNSCIIKKNNGKVVYCSDDYPPFNGESEKIIPTVTEIPQRIITNAPENSIPVYRCYSDTLATKQIDCPSNIITEKQTFNP
jgi:hypothetical protein